MKAVFIFSLTLFSSLAMAELKKVDNLHDYFRAVKNVIYTSDFECNYTRVADNRNNIWTEESLVEKLAQVNKVSVDESGEQPLIRFALGDSSDDGDIFYFDIITDSNYKTITEIKFIESYCKTSMTDENIGDLRNPVFKTQTRHLCENIYTGGCKLKK